MKILTSIVFAATCISATAFARPGGPQPSAVQPTVLKLAPKVACRFTGTPVEFPNDMRVENAGQVPIKQGTKVSWQSENGAHKGTVTLSKDLAPGANEFFSGVVAGGIEAGHPCKASLLTRLQIK